MSLRSGIADLLRHNSCWGKPVVRNATNQCNKDYASSAQDLLNKNKHEMTYTETRDWCKWVLFRIPHPHYSPSSIQFRFDFKETKANIYFDINIVLCFFSFIYTL